MKRIRERKPYLSVHVVNQGPRNSCEPVRVVFMARVWIENGKHKRLDLFILQLRAALIWIHLSWPHYVDCWWRDAVYCTEDGENYVLHFYDWLRRMQSAERFRRRQRRFQRHLWLLREFCARNSIASAYLVKLRINFDQKSNKRNEKNQ